MKLGILTDIHEHVEYLRLALDRFVQRRVERVVVIGDVFEMGERIEETCRLLEGVSADGVWGNHDFGLCVDPDVETRSKYPATVIDFMTSLRPRLDIDGCHFTHVEPWLDPEDVLQLWYYDGPPCKPSELDRIFNAAPNRVMFAGHFHRWLLATKDKVVNWTGNHSVCLNKGRYYVVIGALCNGQYAIFDTETSKLEPFNEK